MAKKKTTYFQAICYTTDHCDGDLIAPACWEPTQDRATAAHDIMKEIEESFSGMIRTAKHPGPDYITVEYRCDTSDSNDWFSVHIKHWKRHKDFFDQLQNGLSDGTFCTVKVTVPEYLNYAMVQIDERTDVFYINSFTL